jgi:Parkin co-regulated protein
MPKARGNSISTKSNLHDSGIPKPVPLYGRPSDKLTQIKTANPFASNKSKQKTNFGYAYTAGSIPCRINHGCNFNKLQWDTSPELIETYDPILINCFEGLQETDHPYQFVAFTAIKELLDARGAE